MTHRLTAETANRFAEIALGHVTKEFPHKLDHVLEGPEDALPPRELHPIFFGSFDWHSCVMAIGCSFDFGGFSRTCPRPRESRLCSTRC